MGRILVLGALALVACYSPPHPACGFICGTGGSCPTDYTCARDNFCHLNGTPDTLQCAPPDAALPDAIDADLSPAHVIMTVPGNGDTSVGRTLSIVVTFDHPVTNVTNASFVVMENGFSALGTVTTSGDSATFMPGPPLDAGVLVTVNLTSAIINAHGVPLTPYSFSFTTLDDIAPTLQSSLPLNGDTGVAVTSTIVVTFSEQVLHVDGTSFTVAQGATPITGTITSGNNIDFTFTPAANLPAASLITVNLSAAITDVAGNALVPVQLAFTTQ